MQSDWMPLKKFPGYAYTPNGDVVRIDKNNVLKKHHRQNYAVVFIIKNYHTWTVRLDELQKEFEEFIK